MTPKTKRNLLRILPYGLIWLILGWIFLAVEHLAVGNTGEFATTAIRMDFEVFIFASLAVTLVGMLIGTIELFFLDPLFAKKSFARKILYKLIIYSVFLFMIILITFPIAASMEMSTGLFDRRVWDKYFEFLTSVTHLSTVLQMSTSLVVSLFYGEISDNIGHKVLINFFSGKYHRPIQEKRIFMFLDMRSSTTIAEKLGNIKYFNLLKDYYADLSDAIVRNDGEIYQYVGDEVIVSWEYKNGIRKNSCLECFFDMKKDLNKRKDAYLKKYEVMPEFKAGLHFGEVTTGEIGVVKKDILFSGDVLNSTARIQGLCNTYEVDILISADILRSLDIQPKYKAVSKGFNELRGKKEAMELYTIVTANS